MEKIQTIEQYIDAQMGDKITRKRNSPVMGLMLLVIGIGLLIPLINTKMADSMETATLTVCAITTAVGLLLTAMWISGALWHYYYVPTHSRMHDKKVYLSVSDYQHCVDSITDGNSKALATLLPVVSSNNAVRVLWSTDGAAALLQAGRYDSGHFEPETAVMRLSGTEIAAIKQLCK